jgi:hypothetical protein
MLALANSGPCPGFVRQGDADDFVSPPPASRALKKASATENQVMASYPDKNGHQQLLENCAPVESTDARVLATTVHVGGWQSPTLCATTVSFVDIFPIWPSLISV